MWRYYAQQFGYLAGAAEQNNACRLRADTMQRFDQWLDSLHCKLSKNPDVDEAAMRGFLRADFWTGWQRGYNASSPHAVVLPDYELVHVN